MLSNQQIYKISATSANWLVGWITLLSQGFRSAGFQFYTPVGSSFVIKFVCSMQETKPDFTAASSATNMWSYIQEVNLNDWSAVTGATWITVNGETSYAWELNANNSGIIWVGAILSSYSAGSITWVYALSNNI